MSEFKHLPKSVKKAVRYIKQDAPEEKLEVIKKALDDAFAVREKDREL